MESFYKNCKNWINHHWKIYFSFIWFSYYTDCLSLRIVKFDVPAAISNGSHAILYCDYDLENNELYSVKFYKDYIEFYRYLPKEDYPKQSFNLDGIHLDVSINEKQ